MYQNEIEQLKSFNGTIAPNLVTLLTTFKHQDKRHFLFPWATCDLFSYWDTEQTQPRMLENARWFSKQIVGLVEAVSAIHWPLHMEHRYGRHGDLKPDNILWFKPYKKDPKGILVVSDMGFTVAHSTYSRSKDAPGKVAHFTPEYRPPELDTETGFVSRKYDVWTLGCIFLEMVIWFLGGKEERDQFRADRRSVEQKYGTSIFTFFALVSRGSELQAHVKQSVFDHMEKIRQHAYKSQFTHDIVNIIQNHMILVDPGERADIRSLQKEFAKINDKCQKDTNYSKMATPSNSVLEQDTQGNYTWLCPSRSMCSACLGASNTDE
ncbi:kinase-like domain-containing protein [Nemania serpens]|nr:kinase-like domain-containing protein [Nemania serpens]